MARRKTKEPYSLDESAHAVSGAAYTLKQGDSFAGFGADGNADPAREATGLFRHDTQLVSRWNISFEDIKWDRAEISPSRTFLRLSGQTGDFAVSREIVLYQGRILEKITLRNTGTAPAKAALRFDFGTEFKDIFSVRGDPHVKTGRSKAKTAAQGTVFTHHGIDGKTRPCAFYFSQIPQKTENGSAVFSCTAGAGETRDILLCGGAPEKDGFIPSLQYFEDAKNAAEQDYARLYGKGAQIESSDRDFNTWLQTSQADLAMLLSPFEGEDYPWAGIPWFATMFGRDAVITALQTLFFKPEIAKSVLTVLGKHQADTVDKKTEAEPGKVFHEMRRGESSQSGQNPFSCYYGGVDTTPLYVMLAGEYRTRTGDTDFIRSEWPHLKAALDWIIDNTAQNGGLVAHDIPEDRKGLTVQSWMDSADSMFHEDGTLPKGPLAVCEVQGYAYAAFREGAKMAAALGFDDLAADYETRAAKLKKTFNAKFWSEELETYLRALDGSGDAQKPCRIKGSGAGQLLMTGIVPPEHAKSVVRQLMAKDSFSGFGIRTLAKNQPRYDDLGYHRGTVWPHDNALIARGLMKSGFRKEAQKLIRAQCDAAGFYPEQRLPELFGGAARTEGAPPQAYPASCSPQAWAAGAALSCLETLLAPEIDLKKKNVTFRAKDLPSWAGEIRISGLETGGEKQDFTVKPAQRAAKSRTKPPQLKNP